jgi:hypothetical protein
MRRATAALAFGAVLLCAAFLAVVFHAPQKVIHERSRTVITTPIVSSPATPLHDSIRESKAASRRSVPGRRAGSTSSSRVRGSTGSPVAPVKRATQKRRVPSKKRKTTKTPPKPAKQPQTPSTPPQTQPQHPLVGVTVPAPVTVCSGAVDVNC